MEVATLSSKSQLTLPKNVREAMGVAAGDKIRFVPARNGFRLVVIRRDLPSLCGAFKKYHRGKPVSIAAMNRAIAQAGSRPEPED